jgi:hypothetical protein
MAISKQNFIRLTGKKELKQIKLIMDYQCQVLVTKNCATLKPINSFIYLQIH